MYFKSQGSDLAISCLVCVVVAGVALAAAPDFEALGRETVAELSTRSFDKVIARFDEKMTHGLPREKLALAWGSVIGQFGEFQSITTVRVREVPAQGVYVVELTSAFEKAPLLVRLAFNDAGRIAGLFFLPVPAPTAGPPPPYADPSAFTEVAISVGSFKLPGTLSMPRGPAHVPSVVFVHGSGPHDRDETIGPNKVFRDLAWGLASRNIAVLRYDKRSLLVPLKEGTVKEEVTEDASAAVDVLASQPGIAAGKVFVLGHSLGGTLAPRIAAANPKVGGIIIMAGTTRAIEEVILEQVRYLTGAESPQTRAAEEFARRIRDPELRADATIDFIGAPMPAGYWLDLRAFRSAEMAASLGIPMLVLQGERDYQVRMADFEGWKKAVDGRRHATLKSYPSLNHLFIAGIGDSRPEEYFRPGHVDPQVITDIANWIQRQ